MVSAQVNSEIMTALEYLGLQWTLAILCLSVIKMKLLLLEISKEAKYFSKLAILTINSFQGFKVHEDLFIQQENLRLVTSLLHLKILK